MSIWCDDTFIGTASQRLEKVNTASFLETCAVEFSDIDSWLTAKFPEPRYLCDWRRRLQHPVGVDRPCADVGSLLPEIYWDVISQGSFASHLASTVGEVSSWKTLLKLIRSSFHTFSWKVKKKKNPSGSLETITIGIFWKETWRGKEDAWPTDIVMHSKINCATNCQYPGHLHAKLF